MPKLSCLSFVLLILCIAMEEGFCLVRLASWNLLAPEYVKASKYPWCRLEHLDWGFRKSLIVPQLLKMDADIICLQEVQVDLWPDLLESLQPAYDGILQNMTNHNVASALLVRRASPLEIIRAESRSRVLLTVLQDTSRREGNSKLYLGNVHLEAGETHANSLQRYYQLKSLFKRLANHCQLDKNTLDAASIILAGDFNMLRTSPLHTFLNHGLLQNPKHAKNKPPDTTVQLHDAFLGDSTNAESRPSKIQYQRTEEEESDEYRSLAMTYRTGYVLDYVWTSRHVDIDQTLLFHPSACTKEAQRWPSSEHPSDHLPIGVDLDWQ